MMCVGKVVYMYYEFISPPSLFTGTTVMLSAGTTVMLSAGTTVMLSAGTSRSLALLAPGVLHHFLKINIFPLSVS